MARMVLVITFEHDNCVAQYNSDAKEKPLTLAAPVLSVRETAEQRVSFAPPAELNASHLPGFHPLLQMKASDILQSCLSEMSVSILFSSKVYPISINLQKFQGEESDCERPKGSWREHEQGKWCLLLVSSLLREAGDG